MGNNGYDYNYAINDGTYANHHYNPYMHYGEPQHSYDHLASHHHHHYGPPPQNGPGPENHHHPVHYPQAQPQIPNPHMNQHHHPHHYGHGMDGGMSLNPPSHYNMMPSNTGKSDSYVYLVVWGFVFILPLSIQLVQCTRRRMQKIPTVLLMKKQG